MALICKACGNEIDIKAGGCAMCGAKVTTGTRWWVWAVGATVLLFLAGSVMQQAGSTAASSDAPVRDRVKVVEIQTHSEGSSTSLQVDLHLRNENKFAVKDIVIECDGIADGGAKIDTNRRTLYKRMAPNSEIKEANFDMGFVRPQISEFRCSVNDAAKAG